MSLVQTQQQRGMQMSQTSRPSQQQVGSPSQQQQQQPLAAPAAMRSPATPTSITSRGVANANQIQLPAQVTPIGKWRHPHLDEVARRQEAATFGKQNLQMVLYGIAGLVSTVFVPKMSPVWLSAMLPAGSYTTYFVLALQCLMLFQLYNALLPLWGKKDLIEDIPLTPAQRKLLGLAPSSAPPPPASPYLTPPRIGRTTPRSGSPAAPGSTDSITNMYSTARSASNSPAGASPLATRGPSGSPYRQAMETRRMSGSRGHAGSPLGMSQSSGFLTGQVPSGSVFDLSGGAAGSSPSRNRNASVGLTNKWLYQKRRESTGLYT